MEYVPLHTGGVATRATTLRDGLNRRSNAGGGTWACAGLIWGAQEGICTRPACSAHCGPMPWASMLGWWKVAKWTTLPCQFYVGRKKPPKLRQALASFLPKPNKTSLLIKSFQSVCFNQLCRVTEAGSTYDAPLLFASTEQVPAPAPPHPRPAPT